MKKIIVLTLTFMLAVQMVVPVVANEYIESEYGVAPFYNNTLEVHQASRSMEVQLVAKQQIRCLRILNLK